MLRERREGNSDVRETWIGCCPHALTGDGTGCLWVHRMMLGQLSQSRQVLPETHIWPPCEIKVNIPPVCVLLSGCCAYSWSCLKREVPC